LPAFLKTGLSYNKNMFNFFKPKLAVELANYHGAYEDRVDVRDFNFSEIASGLPPFDWNQGYDVYSVLSNKLPVKDQGMSSSCGGQAFAYQAEVLEGIMNGTLQEKSAKSIYARTYLPGGGSYFRDNSNEFVKYGAADENILTSYENGKPPSEAFMERGQDITQAVINDAKFTEAISYADVNLDIDSVAQAMRANNGAIIIIRGDNNGTWFGKYPQPPTGNRPYWYHFLCCLKATMVNGKKYIGVLNSWGSGVGDNGWQWLSEDWFTTGNVLAVRTHIINKDAVGWVASEYVQNDRTTANLKLREQPGLQSKVLKILRKGTLVDEFSGTSMAQDGLLWCKIQVK
jgi:hypothetical protein